MKTERYTWEGLLEDLAQGEQHYLEFKDSSFLNLEHPHTKNKKIVSIDGLKSHLRPILSQYISAFANGNGGSIVFGVLNNGDLDSNPISENPFGPKISLRDWIEKVALDNIQPSVEHIDSYPLSNADRTRTVFVVSVGRSDTAPHQCAITNKYYVRSATNTVAALHWQIEEIRSRKVSPKLESNWEVIPSPVSLKHIEKLENEATVSVLLSIKNAGAVRAKDWGFELSSEFAKNIEVLDEESFTTASTIFIEDNICHQLYYSKSPLFPSQKIQLMLKLKIPVQLRVVNDYNEPKLTGLCWKDLKYVSDEWKRAGNDRGIDEGSSFKVGVKLFADDIQPELKLFEVADIKFERAIADIVAKWGPPRKVSNLA